MRIFIAEGGGGVFVSRVSLRNVELVVFGQATGAKHVSTDDLLSVFYCAHFVLQHSCIISIVETVSILND